MKTRLLLAGVCLIAMITGCAGGNTAAPSDEKTETVATTNQEANVVENSDERTVTVPKEKADILEKYPELISYLESEDYQSAEAYVHDLVLQQKKEAAGDIEDYLVTVELNSENFDDYFELDVIPEYNSFGDRKTWDRVGVKSKKYEEGLIVYSLDDIVAEFQYMDHSPSESTIESLLYFSPGIAPPAEQYQQPVFTGRIIEGKVTFIKQEYIEDYPIPEIETADQVTVKTEILLRNGETISRYLNPNYPY